MKFKLIEEYLYESKDAEIVAKADGYTVWVPHTYEEICNLGKGTKWYMASTEDDSYFNYYEEYGEDYYILINDSNPSEKYQFHKEWGQYLDKNNKRIDLYDFLIDKQNLLNELIKLDAISNNIQKNIGELIKLKDNGWNYIYNGDYGLSNILKKYIKTVTIEDGVTEIPDRMFKECAGLTSITIPNSVKRIKNFAFLDCTRLTSINIPNGVTNIGNYAFYNCRSLTRISIPNSATSIGDFAFGKCISLKNIRIPEKLENEIKLKIIGIEDVSIVEWY